MSASERDRNATRGTTKRELNFRIGSNKRISTCTLMLLHTHLQSPFVSFVFRALILLSSSLDRLLVLSRSCSLHFIFFSRVCVYCIMKWLVLHLKVLLAAIYHNSFQDSSIISTWRKKRRKKRDARVAFIHFVLRYKFNGNALNNIPQRQSLSCLVLIHHAPWTWTRTHVCEKWRKKNKTK